MLNIVKKIDGRSLLMKLDGRLDSLTAENFENELMLDLKDVDSVTLDCKKLEYVSSAGLRVLLNLQQTLGEDDSLKLMNVNEDIMSVFALTGFDEILQIVH